MVQSLPYMTSLSPPMTTSSNHSEVRYLHLVSTTQSIVHHKLDIKLYDSMSCLNMFSIKV